ncbi:MAG: hypothetical protein Q8K58_12055 [Acidimicrobiales bacterium]|nr:hypothetical protein [Acidimicrobiales bacterium]
MDASVATELLAVQEAGWSAMAEAPLGHVPAHLSVNHFLFDSWVHEYDLMLPRGEQPQLEQAEVEAVIPYVLALAGVATGSTATLDVRVTDPDLRIGVRVADDVTLVEVGTAPSGAPVVEGRAHHIVDRATGRSGGRVEGDAQALAVLDAFGQILSD